MHIRKYLAAAALAVASMLVFSTAIADDFSAGVLFEPMPTIELVTCPDLAHCGVAIELADAALPSIGAADKAACDDLADFALKDCPDRLFDFGSTARRYDPGWRLI